MVRTLSCSRSQSCEFEAAEAFQQSSSSCLNNKYNDESYKFCTPPKARWKQLLAIEELEIESGYSDSSIPTYHSPIITSHDGIDYHHSSLGLFDIPPFYSDTKPSSSSMSRTTSSCSMDIEEDLFEHSSLLTSFPSTRRPSIIEYPISPQLQPVSSFDDMIYPFSLPEQRTPSEDIDIDMDYDIDNSSEVSFGNDIDISNIEEELNSISIRPSPPYRSNHLQEEWDSFRDRNRRRTLSFEIQDSPELDQDEIIITPFSDIAHLPRRSLGNIHCTSRNGPQRMIENRFTSTTYPTQEGCIGLGIDFGNSIKTDHSVSKEPYYPPANRGKSIDWSSFKINSLSTLQDNSTTSYDIEMWQSNQSLHGPALLPSPIPYDSPLCR